MRSFIAVTNFCMSSLADLTINICLAGSVSYVRLRISGFRFMIMSYLRQLCACLCLYVIEFVMK